MVVVSVERGYGGVVSHALSLSLSQARLSADELGKGDWGGCEEKKRAGRVMKNRLCRGLTLSRRRAQLECVVGMHVVGWVTRPRSGARSKCP